MALYSAKPVTDWTVEDVSDWARKVLTFSETNAKTLIGQDMDGKALMLYESRDELYSEVEGIPKPALRKLWAGIEEMKKSLAEPGKQRILALTINESAFIGLRTALII